MSQSAEFGSHLVLPCSRGSHSRARHLLLLVLGGSLWLSEAQQDLGFAGQMDNFGISDLSGICVHQTEENVKATVEIKEGETVMEKIKKNQTHRYFFKSYNVTTMNQPDLYRRLIINLEPCKGIVYLFVRKTRQCFPNPYSCIRNLGMPNEERTDSCQWTHFKSQIDRSRDGAPSFFEVPLTSTKYYISVFATENSAYTLSVIADIGAFPRPGNTGKITARQVSELQVSLTWDYATFEPEGISYAKKYHVYSSLLLDEDNRTNMVVFMRPDKVMNTVCGLEHNTDRSYLEAFPNQCDADWDYCKNSPPKSVECIKPKTLGFCCVNGRCNATIDGVITEKRYVFNVVGESHRGYRSAYSGLIMHTEWMVTRQAASDTTVKVIGAVAGSVLGMVVIIYFLMLKLYG